MDRMKEVFRMHGASPMASCELGFPPADFPADAVSLLAPCGAPWGLRYDLRYPFASWLAHQAALFGTSRSRSQLWLRPYHLDATRLLSPTRLKNHHSTTPVHARLPSCCTTPSLLPCLDPSGLCARTRLACGVTAVMLSLHQ